MLPTERGPPGTDHDTTPEPVLVHEETEAVMSPFSRSVTRPY